MPLLLGGSDIQMMTQSGFLWLGFARFSRCFVAPSTSLSCDEVDGFGIPCLAPGDSADAVVVQVDVGGSLSWGDMILCVVYMGHHALLTLPRQWKYLL